MKQTGKRFLAGLLAVILVCAIIPAVTVPANAGDGDEYAMFVFNQLHISRTNAHLDPDQRGNSSDPTVSGHGLGGMAFDLIGSDLDVKAPFTGKIYSVQSGGDHNVIFQSLYKVRFANGELDYMTILFTHDDYVGDLWSGQIINQGTVFYQQGTYGYGTTGYYGKHLHIEAARGLRTSISAIRANKLQLNDTLYLKKDTNRTKDYISVSAENGGGTISLNWRIVPEGSKPAAPTAWADRATVQAGEQITVRWNAVSGATRYTVYIWKLDFGGSWRDAGFFYDGNGTSYTHTASAGTYDFYIVAYNSAGNSDSTKVTVDALPAFPTAPSGFTDVTASFVNKKITMRSINWDRYVQCTPDNGHVWAGSTNPDGSWEEFTVRSVSNGDIYLVATSNGRRVKTNGEWVATASLANEGNVDLNACLRIYRNDATGAFVFRVRSTGKYIYATSNEWHELFANGPQPGNWEPFEIRIRPQYTTSSVLDNGYYRIKPKSTERSLFQGGGSDNGGAVYLWDWDKNNIAPRTWYFERQSDGTYKVTNQFSGKALEIGGINITNGAPAQQWTYADAKQMKWYVINTGSGYFKLINQLSGSALDIRGGNTANGTAVQQHIDNGTDAQRFELVRQDFSVTYNANGGSGIPAAQTKWRDISLALSTTRPTRSGYDFLGWSTSSTATSATYQPGAAYTGNANLILYAVWKSTVPPTQYTVTYDYAENGGTSATKTTASLVDGAAVDLTPTATKAGWSFAGWNTDPDATTKLSSLTINKSNVTLYAIYYKTVPTVFRSAHTLLSLAYGATVYNKATSAVVIPPDIINEHPGWTPVGWTTETEPGVGPAPEITFSLGGNEVYYGLYKREVTLTYNTDGGTPVTAQTGEQKVNSYDLNTIAAPEFELAAVPIKEGYDFLWWETPAGDVVVPGDRITVSADTTLKAIWREIPPMMYLVSYSADGAYDVPTPQTKTEGQALKLTEAIPVRYGYTFKGWVESETATSADYQPGGNFTKDESVTLYAVWQANTYSVRYNANGGNGTMANSVHTYDTTKALTANAFSKSGYTFAGWAYDPDGEVAFTNGESVNCLSIMNGAVIDLYAVWQATAPTTYSLTVNGGFGSGNYATGATVTITAGTAPNGKVFDKWTATAGTLANENSATTTFTMPAGAATVTANYKNIPDSVKYIFSTKYEATPLNWVLFFVLFGWIWMWFA